MPKELEDLKARRNLIVCRPSSVHFGGFELDRTYHQTLQIINNSEKPIRLLFAFPPSSVFHCQFASQQRESVIAPGLAEDIAVAFTPQNFQYYYDSIQVKSQQVSYVSNSQQTQWATLLVPLHGYPVVNQVSFPPRLDFGMVRVGEMAHKVLEITCSVPIEFEYVVQLVKPHASFTIFPLTGLIPANGKAIIECEFRPSAFATVSTEISLQVSQLGFKTMTCTLVGSSCPDPHIASLPAQNSPQTQVDHRQEDPNGTSPPASPTAKKPRKKIKQSKHTNDNQTEPSTLQLAERVQGYEIPQDLSSVTNVNFVLTQQVGKLKPKDLKKAIEANRALRKKQKDEQGKLVLSRRKSASLLPESEASATRKPAYVSNYLDFETLLVEETNAIERNKVSRQIKEMFFLQELAERAKQEKDLEIQGHKCQIGQQLLTPEQIQQIRSLREQNARIEARMHRDQLRNNVTTQLLNAQSVPPRRAVLPVGFDPHIEPDFKLYKNDMWKRRKRVIQKLVRGISRCILRIRAQKRLDRLKKWLGPGATKVQVQERIANEWKTSSGSSTTSSNYDSTSSLGSGHASSIAHNASAAVDQASKNEFVVNPTLSLECFPLLDEKENKLLAKSHEHAMESVEFPLKFDDFDFFSLRTRDEALFFGHQPMEPPVVPCYIPIENSRALRSGAFDEILTARPSKSAMAACKSASSSKSADTTAAATDADASEDADVNCVQVYSKTSALERMNPRVFVDPNATFRLFTSIQSPRETDIEFALRPKRIFPTPTTSVKSRLAKDFSSLSVARTILTLGHVPEPAPGPRGETKMLLLSLEENESPQAAYTSSALYSDLWDVSREVPKLLTSGNDMERLSDSESDDEELLQQLRSTSTRWEDALQMFEHDQPASKTNDPNDQQTETFERYRCLIQLEREYNEYRQSRLDLLPNRLKELNSLIDNVEYQLVIEGHGPNRPLHGT